MSDEAILAARRYVRELVRSGADREAVVRAVIKDLYPDGLNHGPALFAALSLAVLRDGVSVDWHSRTNVAGAFDGPSMLEHMFVLKWVTRLPASVAEPEERSRPS